MFPPAQSVSLAHVVLHAAAPHAYAPHGTVGGTLQFPVASHAPASVAIPLVQAAAPHGVAEPTKLWQLVGVMPSQIAVAHTLPASPPWQAARALCGVPTIGVHVPTVPAPSHASHWPVHGALQHTPSTQAPSVH
jgi:hypothetical protein